MGKKGVTVCLTLLRDGRKLASFIIFKEKNSYVESNENAWNSSENSDKKIW